MANFLGLPSSLRKVYTLASAGTVDEGILRVAGVKSRVTELMLGDKVGLPPRHPPPKPPSEVICADAVLGFHDLPIPGRSPGAQGGSRELGSDGDGEESVADMLTALLQQTTPSTATPGSAGEGGGDRASSST